MCRPVVLLFILPVLWTVIPTGAASAEPGLSTTGHFVPGGLITGRTEPGNIVTRDGSRVVVSDGGYFLVGLGRNARGVTVINIEDATGATSTFSFDIEEREYDTQRIDGLPTNQVSPNPETLERIAAENALIKEARRRTSADTGFLSGFMWPVVGRISGVFGSQRILNGEPRNPHNGVDIAAPTGTPVLAMADGYVSLVHQDMFYTGKTVILDHGHGLTSIYIHMSDIAVQEGEHLSKGDRIGAVGQTGRATGPHLHWGITLQSTHLDPVLVAGPMPIR